MAGHAPYDPVKAHEYYLRVRQLKGRTKGASKAPGQVKNPGRTDGQAAVRARVGRLRSKLAKLNAARLATETAIREKRKNESATKKKNSDGKTTAAERQASKNYRDKHKTELANKRKHDSKISSGGGSSSSAPSLSSMSVNELQTRLGKIQDAIKSAKSQLSAATQQLGSLAHSALLTEVGSNRYDFHFPTHRKDSVKMADHLADFSGYATRNDLRCSDGRTILKDAFKDNDGQIVPLLWQHGHNDSNNVLGHCRLENRADGVYAHAYFNETPAGKNAKQQVQHGDIKFLSIFANQLVEQAKRVVKGNIREVSLVLAGANPGAYIDNVNVVHSDGFTEPDLEEAYIGTGFEIELEHADTATEGDMAGPTIEDVVNSMTEEQKNVLYFMVAQAMAHDGMDEEGALQHDEEESAESEDDGDADESVESEDAESSDESADEDADGSDDEDNDEAGADVQHDNISQEDDSMTHNVFENGKGTGGNPQVTLSHSDVEGIVADAIKNGSLKGAVESYVLSHGIENIDYLFPDAKTLESTPAFLSRRMEWVDKVLSGVRKSPFSRIKTITADITPDEARARGYIKGNMKNEEYFALAKRETTPQTVYKKQKLDRDDVIDIVDLDVVAWLKAEMKVMLDEEIAGAILVGDGRSIGDDDKIQETKIRPIATDAELYVTTAWVNLDDASSSIEELVDSVIEMRQYYKGTGQPTFYTTEGIIAKFLTVKDNFGRRIYNSTADVAAVLRVADIVPVEVMERDSTLIGIMVNLTDYTLGADKGGQATMFDDFDIDYNKLRYLIETRLSGALTQPKAALVFRKTAASDTLVSPTEPDFDGTTVTVPTVTGVVYKDENGTTLTTASPVVLADGQSITVHAEATSGNYFANNADDTWTYTNTPA